MAADHPTCTDHFPGNFMWSNAALVTKGMAPYGAVAMGEIDEICERLRARQHEPHAWWEEWSSMAARLEKEADTAEAAGLRMTAGHYYLRAGMYYFTAERFIVPGPEKREMGRTAIECPFLVVHGENYRIVPLDSARKLYSAVGSKNKTLKVFALADGGAEHCQVDVDCIADWLAANM